MTKDTKTIHVKDTVTWMSDGVERSGIVTRVEMVETRHKGPQRCLSVRIVGDRTTRGYRFINADKVLSFEPLTSAPERGQ